MSKKKRKSIVQDKSVDFAHSLEQLTPEQISGDDGHIRRVDVISVARRIMLFVSVAVFFYCCYYMTDRIVSKFKANSGYENLKQIFYGDSSVTADGMLIKSVPDIPISSISGKSYRDAEDKSFGQDFVIKSKLQILKDINPDLYGWIKIDGTRVDYPIVQTKDNEYYLNYTFEKEYLYSGTLFVDCANSKSPADNYNTVIYGHNMSDGSMFNTLYNFRDRNLFKNGLIEIITDDGIYIYEVFSVHTVKETDPYFLTSFADGTEAVAFAESMQSLSIYNKKMEFTENDRFITLSTCTNIRADERFAIHGRLILPPREEIDL
ncbi:MAG: class B sortase [Clostridia bacterium]|nr:class B sortase [Clostridia bacterium]